MGLEAVTAKSERKPSQHTLVSTWLGLGFGFGVGFGSGLGLGLGLGLE